MSTAEDIERAVRREGPRHMRQLCIALRSDYLTLGKIVTQLVREGRLVILGTAKDAGYTDIKAHAPMYGVPGQKLVGAPKRRVRTCSGSGQVAGTIVIGRGFKWGAGAA